MIRKISILLIVCLLILCNLPVISQTHCIPPQHLNTAIDELEGSANVVLSWDRPSFADNPSIIYGTAIYNRHTKVVTTSLETLDKSIIINEDSLVFQCFEFFNGAIYGIEAYQCVACGGGIIETYNVGIVDPDEGTFDIMLGSTIEDPISISRNPITGKVYVTLGKQEVLYETKFGILNFNTGLYDPIADFEGQIIMAIDNEGVCYGINTYTDQFGTLDLETGAFTKIITYPFEVLMECQNLSIDRATNELYWAARLVGSSQCPLYKIDKNTGDLTVVGYFPEGLDHQIQSFSILSYPPAKFHVYRDGVRLTMEPLNAPTFTDLTLTEAGEYTYCISAIYDDGCESEKICKIVSICNNCQPVNNLTAVSDGKIAVIRWEYDEPEVLFDIYRNDVFLSQSYSKLYVDKDINSGESYTYCIVPSNRCCEPVPQCSELTPITNISENEFDKNVFVFPNPASGVVTILGKNIIKVTLYHSTGQLIKSYIADSEKVIFNTSSYSEGVYLLQIQNSENIITTRRLVVVH